MKPAVAVLLRARRSGWWWRCAALVLAVLPVISLALLELLGSRHDVGFLSGTAPAYGELEMVSGAAYALSWFAALVVSPILALALIFDRVLARAAARLRRAMRREARGQLEERPR